MLKNTYKIDKNTDFRAARPREKGLRFRVIPFFTSADVSYVRESCLGCRRSKRPRRGVGRASPLPASHSSTGLDLRGLRGAQSLTFVATLLRGFRV